MKANILHDLNGERKDQLLTVVDQQGNPLGVATREECHKGAGKTHLAFMAFVIDKNENIVLTKRNNKKSLWGGFWDASIVSHVLPGETAEIATRRRGREELGIDIEFKNVSEFYYFAEHDNSCENEYCYVLLGKCNEEISPNPVEIDEIKSIRFNDLIKDIDRKPKKYTPWLKLSLENKKIIGLLTDVSS